METFGDAILLLLADALTDVICSVDDDDDVSNDDDERLREAMCAE